MIISVDDLYNLYLQHPVIVTDSRKITPGCLFFALKGDNFDGNNFAAQALTEGAAFAIIDNPCRNAGNTVLVNNVLESIQQLATRYRNSWNFPVIGITGTNGKTTTKELITKVLGSHYRVHATSGNLNNHIGVPLTILSTPASTELAIIEMGANHQGEIDALCKIANPTHGLITNIGKAHLEGFGGYEGVIKAKSELYHFLKNIKGTAFVNGDNDLLISLSKDLDRILYGSSPAFSTSGKIMGADPYLEVELSTSTFRKEIHSNLVGVYNFENVLSVVCVGRSFNVPDEKIIQAIENYVPTNNRSQTVKTGHNLIIMDAYNANPSSMKAALLNFKEMKSNKKAVALGDMLELGEDSPIEHEIIVSLLKELGFNPVILVGPEFMKVSSDFPAFPDSASALAWLQQNPWHDYTILVKGSRGIKMEVIAEAL